MTTSNLDAPRRVLIVSSHPLFGKGLLRLLQARPQAEVTVVGMVSSVEEAVLALDSANPDLVIVDYDDERVNRDEFLAHFVEGARKLRVVLLSLKEGGSEAIVYDRRKLAAAQIDDWLDEWSIQDASTQTLHQIGSKRRKGVMRNPSLIHYAAVAVVVVVLAGLMFAGLQSVNLLPVAASLQSVYIDELFNLHFILIISLFALIVGFMLYSIVVFRRRKGDTTDGPHIEGNTAIEVTWTIVPLLVVLGVSFIGARTLGDVQRPDPRPMQVNVYAQQWSWRFEYPEYNIVSDELYLPVDKQVLLKMQSADVIHSFWVPEFRVKQDVLPGGEKMIRELRVTPNRVGDYKVRCAEMCGTQHAAMEQPVRVVAQNDFDAWVQTLSSEVSTDPVVRGEATAKQMGCLACHSVDGSPLVGPSWKGVFEHEVTLENGETVLADEAYLYESITDPSAKIVEGFTNIMPNLSANMTDEQIQDVIEFIKSLK